ncbi:NnrS family protein [Aquincola tertiaricarbonis]|uniref:NnrS family protein n=1 Tax=Aquincola tertiaricarbonis TaxID=391953 RepID=A0ABY4S4K6_AQUTE|nr:NnrS family protein [Aquincola tertiaricarbonis]URI07918.1 NnrS family protein [Aquincola tertiaricarbonis]
MPSLRLIEEPPAPPASRFALWELGFRPFYLLASAFAALSIPLWALQFSGLLGHSYLAGPVWHAHEMLFGFALAVIVGFLFTAGRNWTSRPTPTGPLLAALAGLWLAGRALVLTPFGWAAAAVNVAFPLAAAVALAIPFFKARNRRNYFFVGLLVLMSVAAGFVHLAQLGLSRLPAWAGLQIGLDLVLFIISVMGGRVIPMFTNNGVPGAAATRHPFVEKAALGSVLVLAAADVVGIRGLPLALLAAAACMAHAARWSLWQPWKTGRVPLVWVLHLAYLWVPVHLVLRALAELGVVAPSAATHALNVGAVGGLIIGMMTRTARGHTARPLKADQFDTACYLLVLLSGVARVVVPLVAPGHTIVAVQCSAALWSAGFGLYAVRYWPVLTRSRLDGKPG